MAAKFSALAANYYNLPPIDTESSIRVNRERRGFCGGCGTKVFSLRRSLAGYKKYIPLTIDGIVLHGRCLYCYPNLPTERGEIRGIDNRVIEGNVIGGREIPIATVVSLPQNMVDIDDDDSLSIDNHTNLESVSMPEPSAPPHEVIVGLKSPFDGIDCSQHFEDSFSKESDYKAEKKNNQQIFVDTNEQEGTTRSILKSMRDFPNCARTQCNAYRELNDIIFSNTKIKKFIGKVGGASAVLTNMQLHLDDAIVQQHACALLMTLAHKSDENRRNIVDLDGIEKTVNVLNHHPYNIDVICTVCGALWSFAFGDANAKLAVGNTGAIQMILSVAKLHLDRVKLHEWIMGLLSTIASEAANQQLILKCEGLNVIVDIMHVSARDPKILRYAYNFLFSFDDVCLCSCIADGAKIILKNILTSSPIECDRSRMLLETLGGM